MFTSCNRYKLDTRYSGAREFFRLDPLSGRLTVRRALKELDSNQAAAPILLRIVAQEVRKSLSDRRKIWGSLATLLKHFTLCLPSYKQFLLLLNSNDFRSTHRLRRQTLWRAEPTSLTIRARPSRLPSLSTTLSTGPRDSSKQREFFLMGGLIYRCTMNG